MSNLNLPDDPKQALAALRESSRQAPVLVFKKSPVCEISLGVEEEFREWLRSRKGESLLVTEIDVIARRALARGLTAELGIAHQSPQALLFRNGDLVWHASHGGIEPSALDAAIKGPKT